MVGFCIGSTQFNNKKLGNIRFDVEKLSSGTGPVGKIRAIDDILNEVIPNLERRVFISSRDLNLDGKGREHKSQEIPIETLDFIDLTKIDGISVYYKHPSRGDYSISLDSRSSSLDEFRVEARALDPKSYAVLNGFKRC